MYGRMWALSGVKGFNLKLLLTNLEMSCRHNLAHQTITRYTHAHIKPRTQNHTWH